MGYGKAVRLRRKALGKTLEEVAERAQLSPNYLGRIENEQVSPSLGIASQVARALGVSTSALLGDDRPLRESAREQTVAYELQTLLNNMNEEARDALLVLARALKRRARRR